MGRSHSWFSMAGTEDALLAFARKAEVWWFPPSPPPQHYCKVIYVTAFVILPEVTIKSDSKGRCTIKTGKGQLAE